MYVRVNGTTYVAPIGSEYLGLARDGVPVAYSPNGFVTRMLLLPGRTLREEDA